MMAHREEAEDMRGWELVIPFTGGGNGGSRIRGDRDIRHEEAEYGRALCFNVTDSGPL